MELFDAAVIGFGLEGRAISEALADAGLHVAVITQSDGENGHARGDIACAFMQTLAESAHLSTNIGGPIVQREERYTAAIDNASSLRDALLDRARRTMDKRCGIEVIGGRAMLVDRSHVAVATTQQTLYVEAKRLFIDTGSLPLSPPIHGVNSPRVLTEDTLSKLRQFPKQLVVVGGGRTGVQLASIYADFGAQVTILHRDETILSQEYPDTAAAIQNNLQHRGVNIVCNANVRRIDDEHDQVLVVAHTDGHDKRYPAHAVLLATGRTSDTTGLNLEAAGIELDEHGAVRTDKHLRTTADNVWALGEVANASKPACVSYDDYRIAASDVLGDGQRTTQNRGAVPYCTFTRPPAAHVGISENAARKHGLDVHVYNIPADEAPCANAAQSPASFMKAVVDAHTNAVLGMELFCEDAQELANIAKLAIDECIPATALRDAAFVRPSISAAFNKLFECE